MGGIGKKKSLDGVLESDVVNRSYNKRQGKKNGAGIAPTEKGGKEEFKWLGEDFGMVFNSLDFLVHGVVR